MRKQATKRLRLEIKESGHNCILGKKLGLLRCQGTGARKKVWGLET